MRTFIGFVLVVMIASSPTAAQEATAVVSKDSLEFRIPVPDAVSEWEWNLLPRGTVEHEWVFDISVKQPAKWPFDVGLTTIHFGIIQESAGPPAVRGDLSKLLMHSGAYFWAAQEHDGTALPDGAPDLGVSPRYDGGAIRLVIRRRYQVEFMVRLRPEEMTLRGVRVDGSRYEEAVAVINSRDPREAEARAISGPFSPDEYAIYQTVIDRAFHDAMIKFSVLNPSVDAGLFSDMDGNIQGLRAADETLADYVKKRSMQTDLMSLTTLGYHIVDSKHVDGRERVCSVRVSRIGFNAAGDQALLYCDHSCGSLTGEGEVILLEKVDGEWRVMRRVGLWIS
jgi:hypothetical protein